MNTSAKGLSNLTKDKKSIPPKAPKKPKPANISIKTANRRLPDYSLLSELCVALSVSINELFLGERISSEKYKEKAEENMSKLIKENYSKELL